MSKPVKLIYEQHGNKFRAAKLNAYGNAVARMEGTCPKDECEGILAIWGGELPRERVDDMSGLKLIRDILPR